MHAIQNMSSEISSSIRQSTYAIVASQENLRRTFEQGFNAVNNTLEIGFTMMSSKLDEMADRICSKLDEIHDIVNNPLLTASRELYRRALTNYNKGYYEEALEDCKAAVEKNKTDFISWNLLGQIYLFGAGKFSDVIDLNLAEESFFTAAKYIDADIGHSSEANALASEIYYYLGYTRLVKSNDYLIENKSTDSNTKLIEAENASGRAYKLSKENLLAGYEQAKELHFLGNEGEAMRLLEEIIRADKNFALKASTDKNFESIWEKIDALIVRLRDELAGKIKERCEEIRTLANKRIEELKTEFDGLELSLERYIDEFRKYGVKDKFWGNTQENQYRHIYEQKDSFPKVAKETKSIIDEHINEVKGILDKDYFSVREFFEIFDVETSVQKCTSKLHSFVEDQKQAVMTLDNYMKAKEKYVAAGEETEKEDKVFITGAVVSGILGAALMFFCYVEGFKKAQGFETAVVIFAWLFWTVLIAVGGGLLTEKIFKKIKEWF